MRRSVITRNESRRAFAANGTARERLNRERYIQIINASSMTSTRTMEAMWSMHPEWYDAIRQLNVDALETDRSWWEEKKRNVGRAVGLQSDYVGAG